MAIHNYSSIGWIRNMEIHKSMHEANIWNFINQLWRSISGLHYWPFVKSRVNTLTKGQWYGGLMFSSLWTKTFWWTNSHVDGCFTETLWCSCDVTDVYSYETVWAFTNFYLNSRSLWWEVSISSCNRLTPNRCNATIQANDDTVPWIPFN